MTPQIMPSWNLSTGNPDAPLVVYGRPSHTRNARKMFPLIIAELTAFLDSAPGKRLFKVVREIMRRMDEAEKQAHLAALQGTSLDTLLPDISNPPTQVVEVLGVEEETAEKSEVEETMKMLPLFAEAANIITTDGMQVWEFMEEKALPILTTVTNDELEEAGELPELIAMAIGAVLWHWRRNARPETIAALGKSLSGLNADESPPAASQESADPAENVATA